MEQMMKYYMDIIKHNIIQNNDKVKVFSEAYLKLKSEHSIDLFLRKKIEILLKN